MLEGEHIRLRPLEERDLPLLVRWRNNPQIAPWFFNRTPLCEARQPAWFALNVALRAGSPFAALTDPRVTIGTIGLTIDWQNQSVELENIIIDPAHAGKGYATEAERLILDYCWHRLGVRKVTGELFADNTPMMAVHKKFGFQVEGLLREAVFNGAWRDVLCIGLLRSEVEGK
jgi:RimJ/RimL family protein N-acetyltransferase